MKNIFSTLTKTINRYSKGVIAFVLFFGVSYVIAVTVLQYITGIEPAESTNNLVKAFCCGEFGALGFIKASESVSDAIKKRKGKPDEEEFRG